MSTYFDGARLRQSQIGHFSPKDLWRWCVDHYGLVGALFTLLGTFSSLLTIWFYLGEIDGRDLFIPAMLDSKVWGFIVFAGILFLFITIFLLSYGAFATFLILRAVRTGSRQDRIGASILGMSALVNAAATVMLFVGASKDPVEYIAASLCYLVIVIPPAWYFHKKIWQETFWLPLLMFSIFALVVFLWAGSSQVSKYVTRLAGISQDASQACYYLLEKQLAPAFRANDAWQLKTEGETYTVYGYKIFQLSDVTVLCPIETKTERTQKNKFGYCVQMKSSEVRTMPKNFVPKSKADEICSFGNREPALNLKK
jgi:hypothetical protein